MKIVFFGTPFFSAYILEKLQHHFEVAAVVCPPDKESGRGRKIKACGVKQKAEELGITVFQPKNMKDNAFINQIRKLEADLFIVVAFRMLPKEVWKIPKKGSVNLHTSLLPNYRGAAPINWAIINGEKQTGISTFFINEKIDEGNIIMQDKIELDKLNFGMTQKLASIHSPVNASTEKITKKIILKCFSDKKNSFKIKI